MLWGEPLAGTADFMARVRKAAGIQSITFSLSTRPILADTEDKAWNRAQDILARVTARTGGVENPNNCVAENVGSQRLLAAAAAGDVHGTCLWTKLAAAAGARGNSTALVGTPDTIAKAIQTRRHEPTHSGLRSTSGRHPIRQRTYSKGT
jgi:alkanesulfonate monooxygenase